MPIRVNQESVLSTVGRTNNLAGSIEGGGGQVAQVANQLNGQVTEALSAAVASITNLADQVRNDAQRILTEHASTDWSSATRDAVNAAVERCNAGVNQALARAEGDQEQVRRAVVGTMTDWIGRVDADLRRSLTEVNHAVQAVNANATGFANDAIDLDRTYAGRRV